MEFKPGENDDRRPSGAGAASQSAEGTDRTGTTLAPRSQRPGVDTIETGQPSGDDSASPLTSGAARLSAALQYRDPNRYQILGEHGRGGLGRVFRARDRELGRDVAVKELLGRGSVAELRFFREALITARLEHPGIVPVHEAGRWPDGTPFYAMKLVAGRSLATLIGQAHTVEARLALLPHVIAIADAIGYAHDRQIIHRDLKPSNVIVGDFGETIVIDWGLAKDLSLPQTDSIDAGPYRAPSAPDGLTIDGAIMGTPVYMAPEQAAGGPVDARTDVYAIGVILYELCTGSATSSPSHKGDLEPELRQVDRDLAAIVRKALSRDPADRYPSAGVLAADLKAFESGARIAARHYTLPGVLRHWITRHKRLAIAVAISTLVAGIAAIFSISEIIAQRDLANRALREAETERDRAVASEASALLTEDPTRARDLLSTLTPRTLQNAWLLGRAAQGSAAHVLRVDGQIFQLIADPGTSDIALFTEDRDLYSVNGVTGEMRVLDRDLTGPLDRSEGAWWYARQSTRDAAVTLVSSKGSAVDVGHLLSGMSSRLLSSALGLHILEPSGDLYRIDGGRPRLVRRGVRSAAADGHLFLVCTVDDVLEVERAGRSILRSRCGANPSVRPMAAAGDNFAALLDDRTFLLARGDSRIELPIPVQGEFEVALSAVGLFALADYNDKAWLVRPGRDQAELGPIHTSQPLSVAARGHLAAWGYADGTLAVVDASTGKTWRFRGHRGRVEFIRIDDRNARVVSAAGDEIRIWDLRPRRWESLKRAIGAVRCEVFNSALSPDAQHAAFDCSDGTVRVWSRRSGVLRLLHRHDHLAFGVAWMGGMVCSGGWDGRVLCSPPDGSGTRQVLSGEGRIRWLSASSGGDALYIATSAFHIYKYDGRLERLFSHDAMPYRLAHAPDGRWLASVTHDGSLVVYDLTAGQVTSRVKAHKGQVTAVSWSAGDLWTSGVDAELRRWTLHQGTLRLRQTIHESGPFKFTKMFDGGWAASVGTRVLVVADTSAAGGVRLDLGKPILQVEVSPDGDRIAAASSGEVVVVDRRRSAIARLSTDKDTPAFVGFVDAGSFVIGTPTALTLVPTSSLDFIPFGTTEKKE